MKFGPCPVADAEGTILAHSIQVNGKRLRKAHLLTHEDIETLGAARMMPSRAA